MVEETTNLAEDVIPTDEKIIQFGKNIELKGFYIDRSSMEILKKLIGSHVRKYQQTLKDFDRLSLTLKGVHQIEQGGKLELRGNLFCQGKVYSASHVEKNLFVLVAEVLKKLDSEVSHHNNK